MRVVWHGRAKTRFPSSLKSFSFPLPQDKFTNFPREIPHGVDRLWSPEVAIIARQRICPYSPANSPWLESTRKTGSTCVLTRPTPSSVSRFRRKRATAAVAHSVELDSLIYHYSLATMNRSHETRKSFRGVT